MQNRRWKFAFKKFSFNRGLPLALAMAGAAVVFAANANWFSINTAYGPSGNGLSAPLTLTSYGVADAVDVNDAAHGVYSLVSTAPSVNPTGYIGPYSIARRTSAGVLDTAFGASGLITSFANSAASGPNYNFGGICIDPVSHHIVVIATVVGSPQTSTVERLVPTAGSATAALDASFNSSGTTPGTVSLSMPEANGCTVLGDQSILVSGHDNSNPTNSVVAKLTAAGTLDSTWGTGGVVTVTPPNGQNWEAGNGFILWNSSQTVNPDIFLVGDTYPTGNQGANVSAVIGLDRCTGAADASFGTNGFLAIPVIDNDTFKGALAGAVLTNGHLVLALGAPTNTALNVDLLEYPYPVAAGTGYVTPTYPGSIVVPSGITLGTGGESGTVVQSDGSILSGVQSASNQQEFAALVGTSTLGFTVAAPAVFNCGGGTSVTVPNVVGDTQAAATTAITGAGLTLGGVTMQASSTVASGNVISESPVAGSMVAAQAAVSLVLSSGPPMVAVPNVVGDTQAAATTAITGAGLTVGAVTQQSSTSVASGSVVSESPAAGTSVASGSAVAVVVSSGAGSGGGGSSGGKHGGGGALDAFDLLALLLLAALAAASPRPRRLAQGVDTAAPPINGRQPPARIHRADARLQRIWDHAAASAGGPAALCRVHLLPGSTDASPAARGSYDSDKEAKLTLAEFTEWLRLELAGAYHHTIHRMLGKHDDRSQTRPARRPRSIRHRLLARQPPQTSTQRTAFLAHSLLDRLVTRDCATARVAVGSLRPAQSDATLCPGTQSSL